MKNSQTILDKIFLISGNFFFRFRNYLFPVVYVLLLAFTKPQVFTERPSLNFWATVLGALIALSGQAFRLLVIGYAYIKRGGLEGRVYADDLVVRGFYAHSRNPMYIGNILIVIGWCAMWGSWPAYALVIPFFVFAYLSITVAEETYLKKKFGAQYEDYERRVNRFWPNFKGLGKSLEGFHYDWKRAIRKDYGNVFTTVGGILVIAAWKNYFFIGKEAVKLAGFGFIGLIIFYILVRFLKKSGQLASSN